MLPPAERDTIVAPATPVWPAGVAVVRLSGPQAHAIAQQLTARSADRPGQLQLCAVTDPRDGGRIDRGYVAFFKAPRSFTGQDVAEFQVHGSPAVVDKLLEVCAALGARLAEPGEFTWRAYEAGKLDLLQVEALADLISAQSETQRQTALQQLDGGLSERITRLRAPLLHVLAQVEARLDFAAEPHLAHLDPAPLLADLAELQTEVEDLAGTAQAGQVRLRGARVVLFGAPNAGKSTLLNALVELDRALVDARPGTTRDTLEVQTAPQGVLVTWIDTAGVREAEDPVERAGTERARREVERADVVLWCRDASAPNEPELPLPDTPAVVIAVATKVDVAPAPADQWPVAAPQGLGVRGLRQQVVAQVRELARGPRGAEVVISRERHRHALLRASEGLQRARAGLQRGEELELVAADLHDAADELAEMLGHLAPDTILGTIFASFCIGK
ncbi:MAG: tRNA uridine-5-carboxymethylaminomethyl(34) synthesis GTPase MnmE [Deltaproteobacteria bacterium]|nr:tRNA uridine-5-carboxymethylaminomethyl(34) synthesis GTPase MnmE [Deltaproteobacteria bacterium]